MSMKRIPVSTARQILKLELEILELERQVFDLKKKLASTKVKYEKQIAELKARKPPVLTEKKRSEIIERRDRALLSNKGD
jgi:hypothetical protein